LPVLDPSGAALGNNLPSEDMAGQPQPRVFWWANDKTALYLEEREVSSSRRKAT